MSRRAPGGQAESSVARYSASAAATTGPSPARISCGRGRGGSTSRENGTSRVTASAHSVSRLGLPAPDSSWDSGDLAFPAQRVRDHLHGSLGRGHGVVSHPPIPARVRLVSLTFGLTNAGPNVQYE